MKKSIWGGFLLLIAVSTLSCGSSKKMTASAPVDMVEETIPLSGSQYFSDSEYYRAVQNAASKDRSTAQKIAMQNCRQELATNIQSDMQIVIENYTKNQDTGVSAEHKAQYQELAYTVPIEESIRIQTRSIMGTEIPHVKYDAKQNDLTYSFSTTHESIDIAREAFREVKDLTIKLSMVENAAYRLATNIKKTQKRANALKNITIPMYSNLVYTINNALEEKEREEFTRLKVIKRMQTGGK